MTEAPHPPAHHDKKIAADTIKIVIPLLLTVALMAWLFHKVDFNNVIAIIHQGVDYRFILLMMVLIVLSHMIRGVRWGIQLRAAGIARVPVMAESVSIFGAYALNLLFPYLGEAWRCVYIQRRQKCKLSTVIGTDLGDRASDAAVIAILILLTMTVAGKSLEQFIHKYPAGQILDKLIDNGGLWMSLLIFLVIVVAVCIIFRHTTPVKNMLTSLMRAWRGFAVLLHMKHTGMYIFLTFGIWICYFLETYVCFFAFPFTRHLITDYGTAWGLIPGLVVFVFGSCSMGVPSNGGLGPWNIAVMFALSLYGISNTEGTAFSLLCWSFQAITQVICGIFSIGYIMWDRHRPNL